MVHTHNNSTKEEHLLYSTGLSAVIFLPCIIAVLIVVLAFYITHELPYGSLISRGVWLICFLKTGSTILTFNTSKFAITNKRVFGQIGYINIESLDILLDKVEAIRVNQGLLGRLLNYGHIEVTGTGSTHEILQNIPNPQGFRMMLQQQLDQVDSNLKGGMNTPNTKRFREESQQQVGVRAQHAAAA